MNKILNINNLVQEITQGLKEVHQKTYHGRAEWTSAFKVKLKKLGENHVGILVYPDKDRGGEFLVDLCWSRETIDNWMEDFSGLVLACEIEWNKDIESIIYDFQKLTVIDADIRLFVFQFSSPKEYEEIVDALKKASQFTKHKGYKYILAGSGNEEEEKDIRIEII